MAFKVGDRVTLYRTNYRKLGITKEWVGKSGVIESIGTNDWGSFAVIEAGCDLLDFTIPLTYLKKEKQ